MNDRSKALRQKIRAKLLFLVKTPFHPQWLMTRISRKRQVWVSQLASGDVLDVGCGESNIVRHLDSRVNYVGLDFPDTAVNLYRTRPQVFADAAALPVLAGCFDTVMLLDVLEHVRHPEHALAEACRVTKPGGQLLLTMPFAYPMHDQPFDYQRFTQHGLRNRLTAAGYGTAIFVEASGAIESACLALAISVGQGLIESLSHRRWRLLLAVPCVLLVLTANVVGWLMSKLMPVRELFPATYFIRAIKDERSA